jgi:hypothetical protein
VPNVQLRPADAADFVSSSGPTSVIGSDEDKLEREPEADPVQAAFAAAIVAVLEATEAEATRKRAVGTLLEAFANVRKLLHRGTLQ